MFLLTLNVLQNIEAKNEFVSAISYILKFISFSGMEIQFPDADYVFLDTLNGNFSVNREQGFMAIDKKVYLMLKAINEEKE